MSAYRCGNNLCCREAGGYFKCRECGRVLCFVCDMNRQCDGCEQNRLALAESEVTAPPEAKRPEPNPDCGMCYGAWNGMDRWYMQDCKCSRRCGEPSCKAKESR